MPFANIFSHSVGCLFCFVLLMVSFAVQKLLSLIRSCLLLFLYISLGWKFNVGLIRLKVVLSVDCKESLCFSILEAALITWFRSPSSILNARNDLFSVSHIASIWLTLLPPFLTFKNYWHKDNLSITTIITSIKSFLPHKITYSQILKIRR